MAVEVVGTGTVRHNGILYSAGQLIHDLEAEAKAELVKLGVVKDLEADATTVGQQVRADVAQLGEQIKEDEATVAGQVNAAAAQDVADAKALLAAPGEDVQPPAGSAPAPVPAPAANPAPAPTPDATTVGQQVTPTPPAAQ